MPLVRFCEKLAGRKRQVISSDSESDAEDDQSSRGGSEHPVGDDGAAGNLENALPSSSVASESNLLPGDVVFEEGDTADAPVQAQPAAPGTQARPAKRDRRIKEEQDAATCDGCGNEVAAEEKKDPEFAVKCANDGCETRWVCDVDPLFFFSS